MPIRIDEDVHKWINALKDANKQPSVSAVLRTLILKHYPDIDKIVTEADIKKAEREALLEPLADSDLKDSKE